jgi:hypothetical protein
MLVLLLQNLWIYKILKNLKQYKLLIITALEGYTIKHFMETIYDFKATIIGNVDGSEIASQLCHKNRNYTVMCLYVTMLQLVVTWLPYVHIQHKNNKSFHFDSVFQ